MNEVVVQKIKTCKVPPRVINHLITFPLTSITLTQCNLWTLLKITYIIHYQLYFLCLQQQPSQKRRCSTDTSSMLACRMDPQTESNMNILQTVLISFSNTLHLCTVCPIESLFKLSAVVGVVYGLIHNFVIYL